VLEPLLEIADSAMTYRRRYFAQAELATVLDLLLCDSATRLGWRFQLARSPNHAAICRGIPPPEVLAEQKRLPA